MSRYLSYLQSLFQKEPNEGSNIYTVDENKVYEFASTSASSLMKGYYCQI